MSRPIITKKDNGLQFLFSPQMLKTPCATLVKVDEPEKGCVFVVDAANSAFEKLVGVENIVGKTIHEVFDDQHQTINDWLAQVADGADTQLHQCYLSNVDQWLQVEIFASSHRQLGILATKITPVENTEDVRNATAAIKESEKRFRALVTATSDVVYRMNADWSVMWELEGRGLLSDTGKPNPDWISKYIDPKDHPTVRAAIKRAIETKDMYQLDHQVRLADGTWGTTYSCAVPILDTNGEIVEWFGAATDITGRRRAEEALRDAQFLAEQQKRFYETIIAATPDLVYVFDLDYRFKYANKALLAMWGKTWEDSIGKSLLENGYEPWHAAMHEREIDHIRATKESYRGEVSFPHAVLGRRIYDYILNPVFDADGEVVAIAGTTRDITDIRQAEAALVESEARFRNMAEGSNILIAMDDEQGRGIYFNEAWSRLTGRTNQELLRLGWKDLIHPDDEFAFLEKYKSAAAQQIPFHAGFRILNRLGKYRWLLADFSMKSHGENEFSGFISAAVDLTELKEDEQRKNDFINMVSHELKTPLTSSMGFVQLSRKKALAAGDQHAADILLRTNRQLAKMAEIINGFLNVSRLESAKIQINRQRFDIGILINEVVEEINSFLSFARVSLIGELEKEIIVDADREKIGQVINNLINNAVKYSEHQSPVQVSYSTFDEQVTVCVTDHGAGISERDLPKLFERYYRVEQQENINVAGFGIGLYLCAEIIKGHGQKIWAESTIGQGSSFFFTIAKAKN